MTLSWGRFYAIVRKEFQDLYRNGQVLIMVLTPILIALLYSNIPGIGDSQGHFIFVLPILMAFTMTGMFVQSMIIAEEKEKNTLRVLMLSPASPLEVLLGKSIISSALTLLTIGICMGITGFSLGTSISFWVMTLLCMVLMITIGTIIGLLSKSMTNTSYLGLPVMFLLFIGPAFAPLIQNEWISQLVKFLPTQHFLEGLEKLNGGDTWFDLSSHWGNILIWLVVSLAICLVVYKRNRLDS